MNNISWLVLYFTFPLFITNIEIVNNKSSKMKIITQFNFFFLEKLGEGGTLPNEYPENYVENQIWKDSLEGYGFYNSMMVKHKLLQEDNYNISSLQSKKTHELILI